VPVALCAVSALLVVATGAQPPAGCANAVDSTDPTYGGKVRHLEYREGRAHNVYYHRNPWNADNSYMVGIQSDLERQRNWRVVLYDGSGCLVRTLFTISEFDWRLAWDRNDPDILYTWDQKGTLYRYSVKRGQPEILKSFAKERVRLQPNGPSLNQAGDRILVATSDGVFRSYRLPDGGDERSFRPDYPAGCRPAWADERYIGYRNYVVTLCRTAEPRTSAMLIYDDRGSLVSRLDGIGGGGHYDFSPDGRLAYLRLPGPDRPRWEIHVVDLDGGNDRVVYAASREEARFVQNMHLSWPDRVKDWFVASIFPSASNMPRSYKFPLDEIVLIHASGKHRPLARTYTKIRTREEDFWAQPQASPSADGSRVSFNSNGSGTIGQYILWIPEAPWS
jgi:hypothetical protein